MLTYPQYTLKSQDVYNFTINTLDTLPLRMPGVMQSRDLLRVLVCAAAAKLAVHPACHQLERAPSGPTVLGTLAGQLSDLDALEGHGNDLLARLIPKGLGKRGRHVAMDVIALPYHGTVDEAQQDEVCRSTATCGTTHFFTYATAYAVVQGRRYTLAICRVRAQQTMDRVVRTLLERLVILGIRMQLLLLDRGFYSVRVIGDLITAALPCHASGQTREKARDTRWSYRHLCAGGRKAGAMDVLYLEERSRGPSDLRPGRGVSHHAGPKRASPARGPVVCHLGRHTSPLELDSRHLSGTVWH